MTLQNYQLPWLAKFWFDKCVRSSDSESSFQVVLWEVEICVYYSWRLPTKISSIYKRNGRKCETKLLTALEAHLVEFVSSSHSLLSGVDWFAAGGAFGVFSGNERHYGIEFLFVLFCERQEEVQRWRQYWCVKEFWRHYRNLNPHNERFVWKNKKKVTFHVEGATTQIIVVFAFNVNL